MKKAIYTILGIVAAHVAVAQMQIRVVGHVTGDTEGYNKVYLRNQLAVDSAEIKDGRFEINMQADAPGSRAINIEYDRAKGRMYVPLVLFYDQSGTIEVEFDITKGLSSGRVSGMKSAAAYYNYNNEKSKVFMQARQAVIAKYGEEAFKKGNANYTAAEEYRDEIMNKLNDSLLNIFVDGNSIVSATFILSQVSTLPVDRLEAYYAKLSDSVKGSEEGKSLYARIQGRKNAYVGAMIKNFELPDETGKIRSFEEFKGKYVLLDFWASWCSPCRASFPRIREVYAKLKGKDFVIVNISIDKNKNAWLKAVADEANPWPQLYDDRQVSYEFFNVSAVPTSYLIDPKGKIILKEIGFDPKGGSKMELKLEEIFNVKF